MTATPWDTPQVRALGEERLRLLREAAEKSKDKTGMETWNGWMFFWNMEKNWRLAAHFRLRSRKRCLRLPQQECRKKNRHIWHRSWQCWDCDRAEKPLMISLGLFHVISRLRSNA